MPSTTLSPDMGAAHLCLLKLLAEQPESSQREMSRQLGWSIGKTHYLIRALLEKGLIKIQNFQHSNHKAGYAYYLTPIGIKQKLSLTRDFLARKQIEFDALQREIAMIRAELQDSDAT